MMGAAPDAWRELVSSGVPLEQAVLGACLVYPEAVDLASEETSPDDFAEPTHRLLFDRIVESKREGRRLDVGLLRATLNEQIGSDLGGISLGQYIGRLVHEAPAPMAVKDHIRALKDLADYRRLYSAAETLRERAGRGLAAGLPRTMAVDAMADLDRIVASHLPDHLRRVSGGEAGASAMDRMRRAMAGEVSSAGAPYGVTDLDEITRGLHPGHLTIVAARPSMGKSAFAVSAALSAARAGWPVLFISLEMSADELAERALSSLAYDRRIQVPYFAIRAGNVDDGQYARLEEARRCLDGLPLMIEQQPGLTASQIVTRSRAAAQFLERKGKRLGVVIVDHLGKVRPSDRYSGNRVTELGEITGAMKDMAVELGCAAMVLCQLNRQAEHRENKRPTLGDLRESGRIEEDADNVLMLYREAYYQERTKQDGESAEDRAYRIGEVAHDLEIIVAKQRQGATGVIEAWCDMPSNVITARGRP